VHLVRDALPEAERGGPPLSALVIGVGNPERGDDAAGLAVVRRLQAAAPGIRTLGASGEAARLIDAWQGAERVVIVDACLRRGRAGRVQAFDAVKAPLPVALLRGSTHSLGVAEAIELARALEQLPQQLTVYAIAAKSFEGRVLSPEVEAAVEELAARLASELQPG
jgi:hydrogenase maturation protease